MQVCLAYRSLIKESLYFFYKILIHFFYFHFKYWTLNKMKYEMGYDLLII